MTGSKPFSLNWADVKKSLIAFFAVLIPIFFYNLLQNIDQIQAIFVEFLYETGLPEWILLIVIPAAVSLFFVIKQFLQDNSKK